MPEKEKQNDPLLEENNVLSDSPLQGVCQSKDKLGQTVQVPDQYVQYMSVYIYPCVSVH